MSIAIFMVFLIMLLIACDGGSKGGKLDEKLNEFHETVSLSQESLDEVADDIYQYWHRVIYNDAYNGNINVAIAAAISDNSENLAFIEENDLKIQSLYKEIRDSELKDEIKAVMNAYAEYYELVVNVSGSYNSYSESKEKLKKALASALKSLSLEM